jgi:DNA-binding XRE family transcriptional regulator
LTLSLLLSKFAQVQTVGYHLLTEESMPGASPTVRKRQLGNELRKLRERAGKTQQQAAKWLEITDTGISKMETGKQRVNVSQLRSLFQLYDVRSPEADYLLQLCRDAAQRGWWTSYGKTIPTWFDAYVGIETLAAELWAYESEFVPGLFQTPEYTAAVNAAMSPTRAADEVERIVRLRAERQQRLTGDDPLTVRAVINESVLSREVGAPDVMRAQRARLAEVAQLPNVTLQVLPFSAGAHPGMRCSFILLRFPQQEMDTVYLEMPGAALYVESPAEIARYVETYEKLTELAVAYEAFEGDRQ